jgi:hypothetical protein
MSAAETSIVYAGGMQIFSYGVKYTSALQRWLRLRGVSVTTPMACNREVLSTFDVQLGELAARFSMIICCALPR